MKSRNDARGGGIEHAQARRMRRPPRAFTIIELVVTLAVCSVIAMLAVQNYTVAVARARRTEALNVLHALSVAQEEFFAINGKFSGSFEELGFEVAGQQAVSPTLLRGKQYEFNLSQPGGPTSWYCSAVGDIDYDAWPDIITVGDQR